MQYTVLAMCIRYGCSPVHSHGVYEGSNTVWVVKRAYNLCICSCSACEVLLLNAAIYSLGKISAQTAFGT